MEGRVVVKGKVAVRGQVARGGKAVKRALIHDGGVL